METRAGTIGTGNGKTRRAAGEDGRGDDSGAESRGSDDSGAARKGLAKGPSSSKLANTPMSATNTDRINALNGMVNRHCDEIFKTLSASRESMERKSTIESAFRACRDAFKEVAVILYNLLNDRASKPHTDARNLKSVVKDVLTDLTDRNIISSPNDASFVSNNRRSYAETICSAESTVRVPRGPTVELTNYKTTSFLVMPNGDGVSRFTSSAQTRDALYKALKPAECDLRVEKITFARNNGVKVTARAPDIDKIKTCTRLAETGLKISEDIKLLPRLIIHGIPADMGPENIKKDLMAQNLNGFHNDDVKVIYIYPLKQNRKTTSCVIEVSPAVRRTLFNRGRIFLHFSACNFADHVRVLQCFRCLAFGHLARDYKAAPSCGHCSEPHESKDCEKKEQPSKCCNCQGQNGAATSDIAHSALDATKCPILGKKIKDKIANTNYG